MCRNCLLILLSILSCASAFAQDLTDTLFAVDLSLSANDKRAISEMIRESTLQMPETRSIGLTLFDDTVRGFVAPAVLDTQQIKALNKALADAPAPVRDTSNLAVGVERAIDAFEPEGRAELVVFSRGTIDTQSDDPRARFNEWLEKILLPQAAQNNVAISLLVPQSLNVAPEMLQLFLNSSSHQLIRFDAQREISPELIALMDIPKRLYGADDSLSENRPQAQDAPEQGSSISSANADQSGVANTRSRPMLEGLPIGRMALLVLACLLLVGVFLWRLRVQRKQPEIDDSSMSSGTYRPLTEKPGKTMKDWEKQDSDLSLDRSSSHQSSEARTKPAVVPRSFGNSSSEPGATIVRPSENSEDLKATVIRPPDDSKGSTS